MRLAGNPASLFFGRVRGVIAGEIVERTVPQPLEHCPPVCSRAQRRIHLHQPAILAVDSALVEIKVMRRDFTGHLQSAPAGLADQRQPFPNRVVAQFAHEVVFLDHPERKPRGRDFTLRRPALLVRGGIPVSVEQNGIFTVEADRPPPVAGQRLVELIERGEEKVPDARPHVGLVRHRKRKRPRPGTDARIQSNRDRQVPALKVFPFGGVRRVVDGSGRVVRHVGQMHDPAVNRGRGGCGEIFLVHILAAGVVAGVNVNIPHAGEDQAVIVEFAVGRSQPLADVDDLFPLNPQLPAEDLFGTHQPAGNDHDGSFPQVKSKK